MAIETVLTDALAHGGSGIALSLLDFVTSKVANPKAARLEQKRECLTSIEVLLDSESAQEEPTPNPSQEGNRSGQDARAPRESTPDPSLRQAHDTAQEGNYVVSKDSVEYAQHVTAIRDYLRSSGLVKLQLPFVRRIKNGARNLIFHEKINGLSNLQKLGVAIGVEVLYDSVFGFHYYTNVLKKSPVAAIVLNLYQIPAFWVGLWLGNGIKKFIDIMITPRDEKKLDKAIRQLINDTKIVEIIVNYTPPEVVQSNLAEKGIEMYTSQLTRAGQSAFKHLKQLAETARETAGDMLSSSQKHEEEKEERRKRFDELTKGH